MDQGIDPPAPCPPPRPARYSGDPDLMTCHDPTRTLPMTHHPRSRLALSFALPLLVLAAGCEGETKGNPKAQARETLKKTTQVVLDLKPELEKGGVVTDG